VDRATNATMRINLGKDENSRDEAFDILFWSIAAGRRLISVLDFPAITYQAIGMMSERYEDPLRDLTCAVFRAGMRKTKLEPTFDFG